MAYNPRIKNLENNIVDISASYISVAKAQFTDLNTATTFTQLSGLLAEITTLTSSNTLISADLRVLGTASIGQLNTLNQTSLVIGDKYITILSGGVDHTGINGAGFLWGTSSGPGETTGTLGEHAHVLYDSSIDSLSIFPGLNVEGNTKLLSVSGTTAHFNSITGTLAGDITGNAATVTNGIYTTNIASNATTAVTAGNGLTGGGTTGALTLNIGTITNGGITVAADSISFNANDLVAGTTNADGASFVVIDGSGISKKLAKGTIGLSGFNNDAGFTSNVGDITSVVAGNGLTGGSTSGAATLNIGTITNGGITVAADSISFNGSDLTAGIAGDDASFIVVNSSNLSRKLAKGSIGLSGFNNDVPFGVGSVLTVNTNPPLSGGPISSTGTISLSLNGITDMYIRQSRETSVIGRSGGTASTFGNVADIIATADNQVLRRSGGTLGFGTLANASLTNSSITIGTTAISLGSSSTTLSGLTSVTATTFNGALSGNATTATTLQTTRTIWGQNFNGSANVTGVLSSVTGISNTGLINFSTNSTTRMTIAADGEIYMGPPSLDRGTFNLQVNGTGVWGAGAYTNGSDARLKENINSLEPCLDVICAMRPVTFTYKPDFSKIQDVQTGFIAQEIREVLIGKSYLEGIAPTGPDYLYIAYQNIIPLTVKAIQELNEKNNILQTSNTSLLNKISDLEIRLAALESALLNNGT